VNSKGFPIDASTPVYSIDKAKRWEDISDNVRVYYARSVTDRPVNPLPASAKSPSEREKEHEISSNGRQKRKQIRQQKAMNNESARKARRKPPKLAEEQVQVQVHESGSESSVSGEEERETIMVVSDTYDSKVKAQIMYKEQEAATDKKSKTKLSWQDHV